MHFVDCIFDSSSHLPPNLRHLLGVGCSPDAPLDLAPLTALERLHLSYGHSNGSPVEGDSLLGLERLDRLTSLSVSACSTMPSQLSALAALRRLDLSTQSGVRAYPGWGQHPHLTALSLRGCQLQHLPRGLAALCALRALDLGDNNIGELAHIRGQAWLAAGRPLLCLKLTGVLGGPSGNRCQGIPGHPICRGVWGWG